MKYFWLQCIYHNFFILKYLSELRSLCSLVRLSLLIIGIKRSWQLLLTHCDKFSIDWCLYCSHVRGSCYINNGFLLLWVISAIVMQIASRFVLLDLQRGCLHKHTPSENIPSRSAHNRGILITLKIFKQYSIK